MDTSLPDIVVVVVSYPIQRYKTQYCKNVFKFIYFREILSSPFFFGGIRVDQFLNFICCVFCVLFVSCNIGLSLDCPSDFSNVYLHFFCYIFVVSQRSKMFHAILYLLSTQTLTSRTDQQHQMTMIIKKSFKPINVLRNGGLL